MTKETQIQARHMPREKHEDGLGWKGGTRGKRRGCSLRAKARRKANAPVTGHRYEFILLDYLNALARTKASCFRIKSYRGQTMGNAVKECRARRWRRWFA